MVVTADSPYKSPKDEVCFIFLYLYCKKNLCSAKFYDLFKLNSYYEFQHSKKPYSFGYRVEDQYEGNNIEHTEDSDGENIQGEYIVDLPDGRKQTVSILNKKIID